MIAEVVTTGPGDLLKVNDPKEAESESAESALVEVLLYGKGFRTWDLSV